jgi:hypothetical protein
MSKATWAGVFGSIVVLVGLPGGSPVLAASAPPSKPTAATHAGKASADGEGFKCRRCGKHHKEGEPGFNWPDAVYALDLSEAERASFQRSDTEGVAVVGGKAFFVRGWAPFKVQGREKPYGIGFWVQLSEKDYRDFEAHGRKDHPAYTGRIANQSNYLGPTLGLPARIEHRAAGQRPQIVLLGDNPLARAQEQGIDESTLHGWIEELVHAGEPGPRGKPVVASLDEDGWAVLAPEASKQASVSFPRPPKAGEQVKVALRFVAASSKGDPVAVDASLWLKVEDTTRRDLWSGTLANHPRVPAPISFGSRVWFKPSQVLERAAKPEGQKR